MPPFDIEHPRFAEQQVKDQQEKQDFPTTLVRSPLNIKISKQHCKINSFIYSYDAKKSKWLQFDKKSVFLLLILIENLK